MGSGVDGFRSSGVNVFTGSGVDVISRSGVNMFTYSGVGVFGGAGVGVTAVTAAVGTMGITGAAGEWVQAAVKSRKTSRNGRNRAVLFRAKSSERGIPMFWSFQGNRIPRKTSE